MEIIDHTSEFEEQDITKNKAMAILAYFDILVLIPIFAAKDSKFARFHSNLGLILFFADIICMIIPIIGWIALIAVLVFHVIGIINAAKGEAKNLPLIPENWKIIK
ncbi:MAG: hypothetical protein J5879_05775 [Clostridia bacterium]|nr:hypothetical protein [Clostridia bacterium]